MRTITHYVSRVSTAGNSSIAPEQYPITLPAPPWGNLDASDREETAPHSPPIRGAHSWRSDSVLRRADRYRGR